VSPRHEDEGEGGIGRQGRLLMFGVEIFQLVPKLRNCEVDLSVLRPQGGEVVLRVNPADPESLRMIHDLLEQFLSHHHPRFESGPGGVFT